MADLTATLGVNYEKHSIAQSDAGREFVISITAGSGTLTDAKLKAAIGYLTTSHGADGAGDSAGTIAALGTADGTAFDPAVDTVIYARLQTTADFAVSGVNAAATDTTVAIVAEFAPAK